MPLLSPACFCFFLVGEGRRGGGPNLAVFGDVGQFIPKIYIMIGFVEAKGARGLFACKIGKV